MVTENGIVLKRGYIDGFCRQSFIRDLQIKEEYDTMKNNIKRKDNIKSVTLVIDAYDDRKLEIPLEVWQVDIICRMLGLSVDTTNLDTYSMRSKEQVDSDMKIYYTLELGLQTVNYHTLRNIHNKE